jgi:hypothetical protein
VRKRVPVSAASAVKNDIQTRSKETEVVSLSPQRFPGLAVDFQGSIRARITEFWGKVKVAGSDKLQRTELMGC